MTPSGKVVVGVCGAPHGVRGEIRIKTFTLDPTAIGDYGPLGAEDGRGPFTVTSLRRLRDDMVVARFKEIGDRAAAEALTHARLTIDRSALPPTGEEEFYHADLIGLAVSTETGRALGRVVGVVNFGAGDLIEIARAAGETLLIAFTRAFVPIVDVAGGRIVVTEAATMEGAEDARPEREP